ncbi:hypothetical protein PIB30_046901 [Stylosanthes scabra]|uniref:Uncharacterized protein n=1 Tax=Stylosanthes scabra TaxID=79078 RepID=A0ABU6UIG9_9FABA|nr:hypothetical protein [Stylosanthes scabra]
MLELRRGSVAVLPPQSIVQYVRDAGFGGLLDMRDFDTDSGLLSAFVERWRPETHVSSAVRGGDDHIRMLHTTWVYGRTMSLLGVCEGLPAVVWEIDVADG